MKLGIEVIDELIASLDGLPRRISNERPTIELLEWGAYIGVVSVEWVKSTQRCPAGT
jgi:hypothetical protein